MFKKTADLVKEGTPKVVNVLRLVLKNLHRAEKLHGQRPCARDKYEVWETQEKDTKGRDTKERDKRVRHKGET